MTTHIQRKPRPHIRDGKVKLGTFTKIKGYTWLVLRPSSTNPDHFILKRRAFIPGRKKGQEITIELSKQELLDADSNYNAQRAGDNLLFSHLQLKRVN
jgi:hypothetical protein